MAKNLERAKDFQKTLWAASGWVWTESQFNDNWVMVPTGADWDEWQQLGLMPVSFCPTCGDNDLRNGTSIDKAFSRLGVQIPCCGDCLKILNAERLEFGLEPLAAAEPAMHLLHLFDTVMLSGLVLTTILRLVFGANSVTDFFISIPLVVIALGFWLTLFVGVVASLPARFRSIGSICLLLAGRFSLYGTWFMAVVNAVTYAGLIWTVIGLVFVLVGVIPVAAVALGIFGEWYLLLQLLLGLVVAYVLNSIGSILLSKSRGR